MGGLVLAAIAFVGTHLLLSHPLREPLTRALGEGPFRGLYSIVALATFGVMIWLYHSMGREARLWGAGDALWLVASVLMWLGSILLVGSFARNPAFPGASPSGADPAGIFTITRHPMMWAFAIWAVVHAALVGTPKSLVLDSAILVLALVGSAAQDRKKRLLLGNAWDDWAGRTSFVPFARGLSGPGALAAVGGTIFFFVATWLHPVPAGFWRWIG